MVVSLERLALLHRSGDLTETEYFAAKATVIERERSVHQ
jgi:hypothetical protein